MIMSKKYVCIAADVHCDWEGLNPSFRVYVNDELFTERTWRWTDSYLEESLQIESDPGIYNIRYELVPPHLAHLTVKNSRVSVGPAEIINDTTFRIL
jgi:hypothetical protein